MRTQIQYEDLFQTLLCLILPKIPKENIIPAYQDNLQLTKSVLTPDGREGQRGFENKDTFILFTVDYDPEEQGVFYYPDGSADSNRKLALDVSVYGPESGNLAFVITALVRAHHISCFLNRNGIYLYKTPSEITSIREVVNGLVWQRRDFQIEFNERVELTMITADDKPALSKQHEIMVLKETQK